MRVFIVENHIDTLKWMSRYLETNGHSIMSATNMTEALEALPDAEYDVLLCDINLPDGDGWELLRQIKLAPGTHAIAISGLGTKADVAKSIETGYRRHLLKPFAPQELEAALAELQQEASRGVSR